MEKIFNKELTEDDVDNHDIDLRFENYESFISQGVESPFDIVAFSDMKQRFIKTFGEGN